MSRPVAQPVPESSSRLFDGLGAAERDAVIEAARSIRCRPREILFRQGAAARSVYLLRRGKMKLTRLTPDGQLVLLRLVIPGDPLGGVAALGEQKYPVSAQAADECMLLAWDGRTMDRLLRAHPQLAINFVRFLTERLHDMQRRYEELATQQVEQRLARVLLRLVTRTGRRIEQGVLIDVRLTRQDLAEMTGTTLFTVSRVLNRWQKAGVIRAGRQRVVVLHPHGLVSIADDLPQARTRDNAPS